MSDAQSTDKESAEGQLVASLREQVHRAFLQVLPLITLDQRNGEVLPHVIGGARSGLEEEGGGILSENPGA